MNNLNDKIIEELINSISPKIYRYFTFRVGQQLADDLTQEVLIRVYQSIQDKLFRPSKGSLSMLSYGVAKNVLKESSRKRKWMTSLDEYTESQLQDEQCLEEDAIHKDMQRLLRKAISNLSEIEQEIITLSLDEELKIKEISKIIGHPVGTIKSHLSRSKKKLIALMNDPNKGEIHE